MAATLIVGDPRVVTGWELALRREGHSVETCDHALGFQHRFSGASVDIFIVDITHADGGEAMLIPQVRAIWPECKIVAVTSGYAFRSSALYRMGLWTPDQLMLHPVNPRILCATVAFLWAEGRHVHVRRKLTDGAEDGPKRRIGSGTISFLPGGRRPGA